MNITLQDRRKQLEKYRDEQSFRDEVEYCWGQLEPVYRMIELFRINMAKHVAPDKSIAIPMHRAMGELTCFVVH